MALGQAAENREPITPTAVGVFFAAACVITLVTAITLLAPGGPLDIVWRIKPREHGQLLALSPLAGMGFLLFSAVSAATSLGALGRRQWAWRLALAVFVLNGLSDAARIAFGAWGEGLVGVAATGLIAWWLTRSRVQALFLR
ncbi:MAG: hypothetical protein ACXWK1_21225 [Caulobacteraceae bacterium]